MNPSDTLSGALQATPDGFQHGCGCGDSPTKPVMRFLERSVLANRDKDCVWLDCHVETVCVPTAVTMIACSSKSSLSLWSYYWKKQGARSRFFSMDVEPAECDSFFFVAFSQIID